MTPPRPERCQAINVNGAGCREFRGLEYCRWYELWYCPRHHNARQRTRGHPVVHEHLCGVPGDRSPR